MYWNGKSNRNKPFTFSIIRNIVTSHFRLYNQNLTISEDKEPNTPRVFG